MVAPPIRGSNLPREFSKIAAITYVRLTPLKSGRDSHGRKRGRGYGSIIRRYMVHWTFENSPYMEVQKQKQARFRAISMEILPHINDRELDEDDVRDPCHGCRRGEGDQTMPPPSSNANVATSGGTRTVFPLSHPRRTSWRSQYGRAPAVARPPPFTLSPYKCVGSSGQWNDRGKSTSDPSPRAKKS